MFVNVAYLGKQNEDIVDNSTPLIITAVGYYKPLTIIEMFTERVRGRNDYQLLYVAAGKAHFYLNGTKHTLQAGNMVLYRPRQMQKYRYSPCDKAEVYWVHFTGAEVEALLEKYGFYKGKNIFFGGIEGDFNRLFSQMIKELQLRRSNYSTLLSMYFEQILISADRHFEDSQNASSFTVIEIERATNYFNTNYSKPISITSYAASRGMSAGWFIKNFKKINKVTPAQYLINLRITNAIELLIGSNKNITEIANAVGIEDSLYFSRLFKAHTGFSPLEYKKAENKKSQGQ